MRTYSPTSHLASPMWYFFSPVAAIRAKCKGLQVLGSTALDSVAAVGGAGSLHLAALINISGQNASSAFLFPVGLAVVSLVIGIAARRRVDIVLSALIILAMPIWILGIIVVIGVTRPLDNNSFTLP